MDAGIKAKWIEALRSGKYEQAHTGHLLDDEGRMCCLGVLCDVQGFDLRTIPLDERVTEDPPSHLWAGLTATDRNILASKNDGCYCRAIGQVLERHSFEQIADYIEANF